MAPGIVRIGSDEIGIIEKTFGSPLAPGQLVALNGERGYQADVIQPGVSIHLGVFDKIHRVPRIHIPQGQIGLVIAKDGQPLSPGQKLGRVVNCNHFQDARQFLQQGGQKGNQLDILTPGVYAINTALFDVITSANATEHGMIPEQLKAYKVESDKIGIVTTQDGQPLQGRIAAKIIEGHKKFQNPQVFLDKGGYEGLQEEFLTAGAWYLNPWFVEVEQIPLTYIPTGTVGVVISHVGKTLENPSNEPVEEGYQGICKQPLYTGQYHINRKVKDVIIVPTHKITLDWSNKPKSRTNYDFGLQRLVLRSIDGFDFDIEVTQVFSIPGQNAPKIISQISSRAPETLQSLQEDKTDTGSTKYSSINELVIRVLEPMVGNHFRISAQNYKALDFHRERNQRQKKARDTINPKLKQHGINPEGTFINDIDLPEELEEILTKEALAQQSITRIEAEIKVEEYKAQLSQQRAITNIQDQYVQLEFEKRKALQDIEIRQLELQQQLEFERAREILQLEIFGRKIDLVGGFHNFLAWQKVEQLPQIKLPNVLVNSNGGNGGFLEAVFAPMLGTSTNHSPQLSPYNSPSLTSSQNLPQIESSPPRCPVVLLIDTSSSLSQEYLTQLLRGINTFKREIQQNIMLNANRCIEVTTITFGGSAQIVQNSLTDQEFTVPNLHLGGICAMGQGLEKALKILESCKTRYEKGNIQYLPPWIFLITGSQPQDSWQRAARDVQKAIQQKQLNFMVVGFQDAQENIFSQMSFHYFPLEDLKFNPLFYWIANLVKGMPKKYFLTQLAQTIAIVQDSLQPEQAQNLEDIMEKLIAEADKERPERSRYSPIVGQLRQMATSLGEIGRPILDLIPLITQTLSFRT